MGARFAMRWCPQSGDRLGRILAADFQYFIASTARIAQLGIADCGDPAAIQTVADLHPHNPPAGQSHQRATVFGGAEHPDQIDVTQIDRVGVRGVLGDRR